MMQNLVDIRQEVEAQVIDEEVCIDLIKQGDQIKGYGFYLAKEVVHKDSNTGWEKFCKKQGTDKSTAHRQIEFYKAKSLPIGTDLPNKESQFRELSAPTVEEKVEEYKEVKDMTGKDDPTALDIKIHSKIDGRGIKNDEMKSDLQEYMNTAPTKVREAFSKDNKQTGLKKILDNKDELSDDEMVELISKNILPGENAPAKKVTKKEKENINKSVSDKVEKLEAENDALKKRISELEALDKEHEGMGTFIVFVRHLQSVMMVAKGAAAEGEKARKRIKPEIKKAFELLEVKAGTSEESFKLMKKAYRDKAKTHHPDVSGKDEYMSLINKAYRDLKEFYKTLDVA